MNTVQLAEWLLRRTTGKDHAAAIIGDLVEIGQRKGRAWFWFAVLRVVLAHLWRPALGIVLAAYSIGWLNHLYILMVKNILSTTCRSLSPHTPCLVPHAPWAAVGVVADSLSFSLIVLCAAMFYFAVRFGLRDRLFQITLGSTVLCAALYAVLNYEWRRPIIGVMCAAIGIALIAWALTNRTNRRLAPILLVMVAIGYATQIVLTVSVFKSLPDPLLPFFHLSPDDLHRHPALWLLQGQWWAVIWLITSVSASLRRRSLRTLSTPSPQK
jgi:hypothetical protein